MAYTQINIKEETKNKLIKIKCEMGLTIDELLNVLLLLIKEEEE